MSHTEPDPLLIYNEQVKYAATFCNAIGIATIVASFVRPVVECVGTPTLQCGTTLNVVYFALGLAISVFSLYVLTHLRKEVVLDDRV